MIIFKFKINKMKRIRDDIFNIRSLGNKELKILRTSLREREIELWENYFITKTVQETETLEKLIIGSIHCEPANFPEAMKEKFGECRDVSGEFKIGYFKILYYLSKSPDYRKFDFLRIDIEGNTRDGTQYGPSFGPIYADRVIIKFTMHFKQKYYSYEFLTMCRFDKSIFFQDDRILESRSRGKSVV